MLLLTLPLLLIATTLTAVAMVALVVDVAWTHRATHVDRRAAHDR